MKQLKIEDFEKAFNNRKPKVLGSYAYYSVLVPLVEKDGELHLLYEVRSENLKRQPNEVCFPGGKMEAGESPRECAIRETSEELNIRQKDIRVIAKMDYILTYSSFTMYSYLGVIDYEVIKNAKVNSDEVKEIFLVPVSYLLENEPIIYTFDVEPKIGEDFPYELINSKHGYNWRKGRYVMPIYRYGEHAIWGLTGRITSSLVEIMNKK